MENVADIFELSPTQEGMLFHSLANPGSGVYMERLSATFEGSFDVEKFKLAWQRVVARHPILRTAVFWEDVEKPLQVVFREVDLDFGVLDWREVAANELAEKWICLLKASQRKDFVLNQAPLMRWCLARESDLRWKFSWWHHHMILDGWGVPLILKEVFTQYESLLSGRSIPNVEAPSYREYLLWLQKQDHEAASKFWAGYMAGLEQGFPLGNATKKGGSSSAEESIYLEQILVDSIQRLASQCGVTTNIVFQAAWALLLRQYTRADDVIFGTTVTIRPTEIAGMDQMLGLFINTVPVRVKPSGASTAVELLTGLMKDQSTRQPFLFYSLAEIQSSGGILQDLFESILVFENYPVDADGIQAGGLRVSNVENEETTNYPITVVILPGARFEVKITFHTSRFERSWIRDMLGHFQNLLVGLTTSPGRAPRALPMLSGLQRSAEIGLSQSREMIQSPLWQSEPLFIHELFSKQAHSHMNKVAVVCGTHSLSYGELERQSNALANRLIQDGIVDGNIVGICLDRSISMIVGILGILKVGAIYLPMDPSTPRERMEFMLEDSGAAHLIVSQKYGAKLNLERPRLLIWETWDAASSAISATRPVVQLNAESTAYIIYTSGSTGKPKGVAVSHFNVARLFQSTDEWFGFHCSDVWTLFHSFAFDFSVWEMWGALLFGGKLIVLAYDITRSPDLFHTLVSNEGVTVLNQTPAAFREFIRADEENPKPYNHLRFVIFGGEALDFSMLKPWFARHGDEAPVLVNMYGITETTVHVTYRRIRSTDASQTKSLIGIPLKDLSLYILDQNGEPLPEGIVGEIYVGGAGVAQGYLRRPELTAERFIPDTFSFASGGLLYRTGDLGRRSHGDIEYCGRADHQVKIRGHRIELGEIEEVIRAYPGVQWARVLVRGDDSNRHLVAYTLGSQDLRNLPMTKWREIFGTRLPEYMVPSFVVVIDQIPLTINGKLDTQALPIPAMVVTNHVQDRGILTPAESQIGAVWEEVLEINNPSLDAHFFELGGHSLLAIRVHGRLAGLFEKKLSIVDLFRFPTIRQLAQFVTARGEPLESMTEPAEENDEVKSRRDKRRKRMEQDQDGVTSN